MTWVTEFGAQYAVPAAILDEPGLADVSWHNDACPAFGKNEHDYDYVIWVEHPDPAERELDDGRFTVSTANGETVLFAGDDVDAALAVYRDATRSEQQAAVVVDELKREAIRTELARIIIKAQTRSEHPDTVISEAQALAIVDALVLSDDAPEWDMIKAGRETMHTVVVLYLRPDASNPLAGLITAFDAEAERVTRDRR